MSTEKRKNHRSEAIPLPLAVLLGSLCAVLCGLLLLLLFAFFVNRADDPSSMVKPFSLAALYIGCAVGGALSMRRCNGKSGYLAAAISALLLSVCSVFASICTGGSAFSIWQTALLYLGIFLSFLFGAFLGKKRSSPRKRRKHR